MQNVERRVWREARANVSAHHLMTLIKRTSPNVYEADIFNCPRQRRTRAQVPSLIAPATPLRSRLPAGI
jgi:hypothetical protein